MQDAQLITALETLQRPLAILKILGAPRIGEAPFNKNCWEAPLHSGSGRFIYTSSGRELIAKGIYACAN